MSIPTAYNTDFSLCMIELLEGSITLMVLPQVQNGTCLAYPNFKNLRIK